MKKPVCIIKNFSFIAISLFMTCKVTTSAQNQTSGITSRVPKYTFPNSLQEQETALETNPLMLRFAESRKKFEEDEYRPIYHFVNPEAKLNDPNGLCFWNGNWHLFYQAYPPEDTRQHWGHAVSKDLIHWKDLPYAIYPDPELKCFSGATLVEKDRVIAMYHGIGVGNMIAISKDPLLLNWEKLTGNAVISNKSETGFPLPYSVYDPCIWKKDSIYYSLSGGQSSLGPGGKRIRADYLFRSKDLVHWEYMHELVEDDMFTLVGDDGACPYFWPIGDRYILLFFSHMSSGQYLLGDYDMKNDKLIATSGGKFCFGVPYPSGVHAPSATPDGKGGVITIFNVNQGKPTPGWNQIMTLPRRLSLISKDELGMEPAGDIESLRYDLKHIDKMNLPANREIVLKGISGNTMEIIAEIDPKDAPTLELNILRSPKREEFTTISFYKERGYNKSREIGKMETKYQSLISIESANSSILPDVRSRAAETVPILLNEDENLKLRIFIDKSIVEVFVNGRQCLAVRVYPGLKESLGVSIKSHGRDADLISLDAWQMKSIYE